MNVRDLKKSANKHFKIKGTHALSARCVPGCDAHEVAHQTPPCHLPQNKMRVAQVGALREHGYDVTLTGEPGHASVFLPTPPMDTDWQNLEEIFGDPEDNPVAKGKGHNA